MDQSREYSDPKDYARLALVLGFSVTINCFLAAFVVFRCGTRVWNSARENREVGKVTAIWQALWRAHLGYSSSQQAQSLTRILGSVFLLSCSVYFLVGTEVVFYPFTVATLGGSCDTSHLLRQVSLLCAVGLGHIVYSSLYVAVSSRRKPNSRATVELLYYVVCTGCYVSVLVTGENLLLAVLCAMMEGDFFARRVLQRPHAAEKDVEMRPSCPSGVVVAAAVFMFLVRIVAPVLAIGIGFSNQGILTLSPYSLALLHCALVFFLFHNAGLFFVDVFHTRCRAEYSTLKEKTRHLLRYPKQLKNQNDYSTARHDQYHTQRLPLSTIPINLVEGGLLKAEDSMKAIQQGMASGEPRFLNAPLGDVTLRKPSPGQTDAGKSEDCLSSRSTRHVDPNAGFSHSPTPADPKVHRSIRKMIRYMRATAVPLQAIPEEADPHSAVSPNSNTTGLPNSNTAVSPNSNTAVSPNSNTAVSPNSKPAVSPNFPKLIV